MLKFMRRNASGPWVKGIFLAIVSVFIFWGIGVGIGSKTQSRPPVAKVNGDTITEAEFQRTYANLVRMYQDVYKDNFRPEMIQGLDLKGKAVDQLVRTSLMEQEALRLGLQVSDAEVRDSIATMPVFQQAGHVDKDLYVRILRNNNLTPSQFEDSKREELLVNKLQDLITAGVNVSEADARARYNFENDKVDLNVVEFKPSDYVAQVNVTADEVKQYYDGHQDTFREPDRVRAEYLLYSDDAFMAKAEVADADIQTYYDGHSSEFSRPERVHARHILVRAAEDASPETKAAARKKADDLLAKAKGGSDFAALAKENSEDPGSAPQGGDLGFFPRGQMVPQFEAVAFSIAPGSISEIVETPFGFHIIKVEAKEEAHTQTLAEARDVIVGKLKHEKARELAHTQANTDQTKAAGGTALTELAQGSGLTVKTPAPFAQDDTIEGLGRSPLTRAAFSVDANSVGPVVDVPTGYIVFRVTEKLASQVPPLDAIRTKVEDALKKERAEALAKSKAEALLAEAQKAGLDSAAKAAGLTVEETGGFARAGNYIPKVGTAAELKKAAFDLTAEKPLAPAVYSVDSTQVVAALKERIPADEAQFTQQKASLITQAENMRKNQVLEEFLNYLKARATVELNETYLASVGSNGRSAQR